MRFLGEGGASGPVCARDERGGETKLPAGACALLERLGALLRSDAALVAAVGVIQLVDMTVHRRHSRFLIRAMTDETSHMCTALALSRMLGWPCRTPELLAMLAGSVAIDADHVPMYLGVRGLTPEKGRPYSHCWLALVAAGGAALLAPPKRRELVGSFALGLATHFFRDAATGGLPVAWPFSSRSPELPYGVYAVALLWPVLRWRAMTPRTSQAPRDEPEAATCLS